MMKEKVVEGLKTGNGTSKLYLRSKIHKKLNPGRPELSSVNCHTSKYVGYHLQPIIKEIPSYIKDTKDFFRKVIKK